MGNENKSLTSLRGLAALSVVFLHVISTYSFFSWIESLPSGTIISFTLTRTPLSVIFAGESAVILFFVLSGLVLAIPFVDGNPPSISNFFIRRVFRIYVPYVAASVFALTVRTLVVPHNVPGTTDWFRTFWSDAITASIVIGHLIMTGFSHHINNINPVTWSLVHELRISIIFPFLFAALRLTRSTVSRVSAALLFSAACMVGIHHIRDGAAVSSIAHNVSLSLLQTGQFLWLFVVGIEMARHRVRLRQLGERLAPSLICAIFIMSLSLYCVEKELTYPTLRAISVFLVGLGSTGIITLALISPALQRILTLRPAVFLGEVSYSLYLIHPIILLGVVIGLDGLVPPWIIVALVPLVSVAVAWAARRYIELPSIRAGRKLADALTGCEKAKGQLRVRSGRRIGEELTAVSATALF